MLRVAPRRSLVSVGSLIGAALAVLVSGCHGSSNSSAASQNASLYPRFSYPVSGQLEVDASHDFQWSAVSGALSYQLQVGTTPEANDIFDSGAIKTTSIAVPHLPASGTVYARLRALPAGWSVIGAGSAYPHGTYIAFAMDSQVEGAGFLHPTGAAPADADTPISWQSDPLAVAYSLTVSASDGSILVSTGQIHGTHRVVPGLPSGTTVTASLTTYYSTTTRTQSVAFQVGNPQTTVAGMLAAARQMTGGVRLMADASNQPFAGTTLGLVTASAGTGAADCVSFTQALLQELTDAAFPLSAQGRNVCFNAPDCHTLVEVLDSDQSRWVTLDPTFGLYTLDSSGQAATVDDISLATRTLAFASLSYVYLTPNGAAYAAAYYLDYPLLFLNIIDDAGDVQAQAALPSLSSYLLSDGTSVHGSAPILYTLQCADGAATASATADGDTLTDSCTNGYTQLAFASSVSLIDGDDIWTPRRFTF
jgi:hypothetical protein